MFFHIWGENTMIGATKCIDITKELYPYIFENSQKEIIISIVNLFLGICSITDKVSIFKFDSNL